MGPGRYLVVYRYSTPPDPPSLHHPGTPPHYPATGVTAGYTAARACPRLNMVMGLISVAQLSLSAQISQSSGITEVYNLVEIDRNINHSFIPGNK